jgi:hypothetical protein
VERSLMAKPTAQELTEYAQKIQAAAMLICGNCAVAALALIQAQAKQEAHVLDTHAGDATAREAFEQDVGRLKAAAVRALSKASDLRGADIKTNAAGGSC